MLTDSFLLKQPHETSRNKQRNDVKTLSVYMKGTRQARPSTRDHS